MKKIISIILISLFAIPLFAQHITMFSQPELNMNLINPASVTKDKMNVNLLYRNQWYGFQDSPKTMGFNFLTRKNEMSFGLFVLNDKAGIFNQNTIHLNYSYALQVAKKTKLAFGISGGIDLYGIKFENLKLLQEGDPIMQAQNASAVLPDFNVGLLLYSDSKKDRYAYSSERTVPSYYVGLSVQHILSVITTNEVALNDSYLLKHYNFIGGYTHPVNDISAVEGSVLLKYVSNVPFQADISVKYIYMKNYWLGATYRTDNDIIVKFGLYVNNKILFGYAFDLVTSKIPNKTSHELVLGYKFNIEKEIPKY